MLTETFDIETNRRWFTDDQMDLIIWHDENNQITGFQLCYDKFTPDGEKVLTWSLGKSFIHSRIDNSNGFSHCKSTPMLLSVGNFQYQRVTRDFFKRAKALPSEISNFVLSKLTVYSMTSERTNRLCNMPIPDTTSLYQHNQNIYMLLNSTQADF